jgi:hypothetical protein
MTQLIIALAVAALAVAVGLLLRRRQRADHPQQVSYAAPTQLDRADFPTARGDQWLVAVFSSGTCHTCADVVRKAAVLASPTVAVVDLEYGAATGLHTKYAIEAVPIVCIADPSGAVRASFAGPVTATDLWAAVAEARQPGSRPAGGCPGPGR